MTDNDRREVNRTVTAMVAAVILSMGAAAYVGYRIARDETPRPEAGLPVLTPQPTPFLVPPPPLATPPAAVPSRTTPQPPAATSARNTRPPATTRTTSTTPTAAQEADWDEEVIAATSVLTTGQSWSSNRLRLTVTTSGNLVLRDQGRTVWQTSTTTGVKLVMQNDGHLVLYDARNGTAFSSGTAGHPGAVLILRADGNMVISRSGQILFETGTGD